MNKTLYISKKAQFILDKFKDNNYEAFIVGGSVRDNLLNRKINDFDITTNALPEITESLFDKTIPTGIKHGTITVILENEPFEVTTYRVEGNYIDNRKPEDVIFVSEIEKDLSRRDFTINALAYNPELGLKDFFNGLDDLKNKKIKAVGEPNLRFKEDALRMLRAIRFSAELDFKIEEKTFQGIKNNSQLISNISKERIRDELIKVLISSNPKKAVIELIDCNLLGYIFNFNIVSNYNDKNFIASLNILNKLPNDLTIRSTHLFYCLFNEDLKTISEKLKLLRFDNSNIKNIMILSTNKNFLKENYSIIKLKELINNIGFELTEKLLNYNLIINPKNNFEFILKDFKSLLENNTPIFLNDLNITGKDLILMLKVKGKIIGDILNYLLKEVHKNPNVNDSSNLLILAKNYYNSIK